MNEAQPIIIRWCRGQAVATVVVAAMMALFFAGVTVYSAMHLPGWWAIGATAFCLFFLIAFTGLAWWGWRWSSRGRVRAVINDTGVVAAPESRAPISLKWDEVGDVLLLKSNLLLHRPRMLLLLPTDPRKFLDRQTPWRRLRLRVAWFMFNAKWAIAFGEGLEISLEDLGAHLAEITGRPLQRR